VLYDLVSEVVAHGVCVPAGVIKEVL
jgi:hypothetical protein